MRADRLPRPADSLLLGSLALLAATLFAGPIRWLVVEWQQNDYYAHGPFVPLTCLVLGYLAILRERSSRHDAPVASPLPPGKGQGEGVAHPVFADAIPPATPLPLGEGRVRVRWPRWRRPRYFRTPW